jgi:hypothetical protein
MKTMMVKDATAVSEEKNRSKIFYFGEMAKERTSDGAYFKKNVRVKYR